MDSPGASSASTPDDGDRFLGKWELIPELCLYADGVPPESGRYSLERTGADTLAIAVTWRMPGEAAERAIAFAGVGDGTSVALPPGAAGSANQPDRFTLTRIDASTLDSAAYAGATLVARARRRVSADGMLMATVQESVDPHGAHRRNLQVYRRIDEGCEQAAPAGSGCAPVAVDSSGVRHGATHDPS